MKLGYFKCSGSGASRADLRALEDAGCDQILIDESPFRSSISNSLSARLADMQPGDELIVQRLDHLAAMPVLLTRLGGLIDHGIVVRSISDDLDTSDAKVAATLMTIARYETARPALPRPRRSGKQLALDEAATARARQMIVEEHIPVTEVAKTLGVSRSTIYRHVPLEQEPAG